MASFQAKIGWKGREREKIKIISPFRSYTTHNRKFEKKVAKKLKKILKIKKFHYGFFSSQNRLEKAEKEKKKIYRSISFLPDPALKIRKK